MKSTDPLRNFASRLIDWHAHAGRHDLPWQNTRDAYRIWVAEIMLQQTQVSTVIPYFERFMLRFPTLHTLADADEEAVLTHWAGLGYYARARNLHQAAQRVRDQFAGQFPPDFALILSLPGIGRSTAGAIAAFASGERRAILDGNVKRVLARCFGVVGFPGERQVEVRLWALAEALLPEEAAQVPIYIQAQMDLGATVCTRSRPHCGACPLSEQCVALNEGRVEELPTRKVSEAIPSREVALLVLLSGRSVMLERRPASGIWGGLWSFPELALADDAAGVANIRYGAEGAVVDRLSLIRHSFTHFHLTIHPRVVEVTRRQVGARQPGAVWMSIEDALNAAIPKPVKLMLTGLNAL